MGWNVDGEGWRVVLAGWNGGSVWQMRLAVEEDGMLAILEADGWNIATVGSVVLPLRLYSPPTGLRLAEFMQKRTGKGTLVL